MPTLLLLAHGSTKDPAVSEHVQTIAAAVAALLHEVEVRVAFHKQDPFIRDALALCKGPVVVYPLLMARGYFADEVFPRELGARNDVVWLPPLGEDPRLIDVILECLARHTGHVVIAGHGTPRHPASRTTIERCVAVLRAARQFDSVASGFLDDEPALADVIASPRYNHSSVAVVPYFLADGPHVTVDLPAELHIPPERDVDLRVLRALGADERIPALIVRSTRDALSTSD